MVEGKPYRYGLIAAGLCVVAVAMFIMIQERPHIYATLCTLGVAMVAIGTAWSLCQCYPKVEKCVLMSERMQLPSGCLFMVLNLSHIVLRSNA